MNLANFKPETRNYLIIGIIVYGIEVLTIYVAEFLGAGAIVSVATSFWIGLLFSFFLQKVITFGDHRFGKKVLPKQFFLTVILVVFNFFFTLLVTKLLDRDMSAIFTRTIALGITTIWNFYLYKTRIFKNEPLIID